jgi:hypothetical protein
VVERRCSGTVVLTKRRRRPGGGTGAGAGGVLGGADGDVAESPGGGALEGPVENNEPDPGCSLFGGPDPGCFLYGGPGQTPGTPRGGTGQDFDCKSFRS